MSEIDPKKPTELSAEDLEQVAGGDQDITITKAKAKGLAATPVAGAPKIGTVKGTPGAGF